MAIQDQRQCPDIAVTTYRLVAGLPEVPSDAGGGNPLASDENPVMKDVVVIKNAG